jgi:uncharacterized membrane-anchored protein
MKEKNYEVEEFREESETKSRKYNLLSYIVCVLAAIVIWLVIMNVTDVEIPGSADNETDNQVSSVDRNT